MGRAVMNTLSITNTTSHNVNTRNSVALEQLNHVGIIMLDVTGNSVSTRRQNTDEIVS